MGNICLTTANIPQAKIHFKKAMKIYENVWADEPELIQVQVDLYRVIRLLLGQKNNRLDMARYVDFDVSGSARSRKQIRIVP